ncbi:MAG: hydrogenase expression/formation protein HypE [Candidatus Woesearchaeota archaeon]|jgi:hydrogenase expression/formation protein HypE|nr:hydrogenase expression/formation protein HypE [Candidatus Woesearchaeota archaeon]
MEKKNISLEQGNGGREMNDLLNSFLGNLYRGDKWENFTNDSATFELPNKDTLCFTTDSFVVNPIKFPGGDIGHLAICGTINDLAVMGADPVGLSLSLIIEEGFDIETLNEIMGSINKISKEQQIPIVTGDTKVMEKGAIDKIVINVSGVGITKKIIDEEIITGDKIIISGGIGEHAVALLSQRFDFQTQIISDSKSIYLEMKKIRNLIKFAKDPTRGGIASVLNEVSNEKGIEIELEDSKIPIKKEVRTACNLLGLDPLELANEGRIITIVSKNNSNKVLEELKKFNEMAQIIGEVKSTSNKQGKVILKTSLGSRILQMPSGKIVPRIC